ncbi:MAG: hypothetical protein ACI82A_004370 [Candidatus Azotimanducaceae bacterium]|jgi:hypothetical protein
MSEPGLGHLAAYWFLFAAQAFFAAEPVWDNFLVAATLVPDFLTVIFVGLFLTGVLTAVFFTAVFLTVAVAFFCRRRGTAGSTVFLGLTFREAGFFGTRTSTKSCSPDRSMLHFASYSTNQKWQSAFIGIIQTKLVIVAKATPGSARRSTHTSTAQGIRKIDQISVLLANYPHKLL